MKEPLRLRDPGSQASPELRALLASVEPPAPLPGAARERVRRALASRAAETERRAVCWSHAFGCAFAVATCVTWLVAQRTPDAEPPIAREPAVVAPMPTSTPMPMPTHVERRAPAKTVVVAETREGRAVARAEHRVTARDAIARRAKADRRLAMGPARSRKRIESLVDGILKPEAQLLDRARREAPHDPEQALALIDAFRKQHPGTPLPAPTAVAEVDALRRLGRFEEALAKARALLEGSRKPYYADEMAQRFALLDL